MRGRVVKRRMGRQDFPAQRFFKDFSIGCGSLIFLGLVFFVLLPLIFIAFKIALWLLVPVLGLFLMVVGIAFFGRLVSHIRRYW